MFKPRHGKSRKALTFLMLCALWAYLSPGNDTDAHTQEQVRTINGFEVSSRFLEVWSAQGSEQRSVYVNGLPITPRRPEISLVDGKTYETQWFERASYEAHPENQPPHDVLLGLLGSRIAEGRGALNSETGRARYFSDQPFVSVERPVGIEAEGKMWFPETGHILAGKFLQYWQQYGGLQQFGFPVSEEFEEVSPTDGKPYRVQYFERNRFELHPEKPAPYEVELGLLGVQLFGQQAVPADQLPIAPPKGVTSARDTYVEGSIQEPQTLACSRAGSPVEERFCSAITFGDSLIGVDDKGNYFPLAAWYVPTLENGGSYFVGRGEERRLVTKFKLRPGIKWSDGVELTSQDAIFSHNMIMSDREAVRRPIHVRLSGMDNPDKYTVIYYWLALWEARELIRNPGPSLYYENDPWFLNDFLRMNKPIVDPNYLLVGTVHPQHILSNVPVDKLKESSYATAPVGYGPYKVQEWKKGGQMILAQNEHYNLTDKPLIRRIIVRFDPNFGTTSSGPQYLGGNLDGMSGLGLIIPPEQTARIRAEGNVVDIVPGSAWEHLDFYFGFGPFKDKRVREAIFRGINRRQVADVVYRGNAGIMNGPVPPGVYHSLENPDYAANFPELAAKYKLPIYNYDPARANRLMDEAGWIAPCGNPSQCTREKDGAKLAFEYGTTRSAIRQAAQESVKAHLKVIGVDAITAVYPTGFFDNDGPIRSGKTKLAQFAYVTVATSNFDSWETIYCPIPEKIYCGRDVNWQYYENRKVNEANQLFKSEIDRHKLAEQSAIIQVEMMNDIAVIPLVQRTNIEMYRGKVKGRKTTNSTVPQWWNITQWYLER
jgi:peptide/nickel transport system substrate-binding protein